MMAEEKEEKGRCLLRIPRLLLTLFSWLLQSLFVTNSASRAKANVPVLHNNISDLKPCGRTNGHINRQTDGLMGEQVGQGLDWQQRGGGGGGGGAPVKRHALAVKLQCLRGLYICQNLAAYPLICTTSLAGSPYGEYSARMPRNIMSSAETIYEPRERNIKEEESSCTPCNNIVITCILRTLNLLVQCNDGTYEAAWCKACTRP